MTPSERAPSETLDIRLLGGFEIRVAGEPVEPLRSGRAQSLIAFLIIHGDSAQERSRLAFQFWPDTSEAQARTNLRNLLHTLRRVHPLIDASIRVTPTTLRWRPATPTTVDVDRFAAAVAAADPDNAADLIAACRHAIDQYGGDLLPSDYDDWLVPHRDALQNRYRDVVRLLATALIDAGRPGEATAVAHDLVRVDPLDEAAHRLRIEAHRAAGDRAGAVRAYHECAATLDRELGVQPDPATTAAYAAVLDDPTGAAVRPELVVPQRAGLVGRDREWAALIAAWQAVCDGPPAAVLVTGEPGIGKTRLVDELRSWCARTGAAVGDARSYASEGDLGYGVVVAWLRSPDMAPGLERLTTTQRGDLARLLPELGEPGPVDGADDAERRRRLFDAAGAALVGVGKPALLVADDCHWSDQVSAEFIHYLVRHDAPMLVVLAARKEELDPTHPMTLVCDSLAVHERLVEVDLERLSPSETAEMASQFITSPLPGAAIEALFAETEGNPLFIVETMRSGWRGTAEPVALSPRLRTVIDARFHRLSGPAAELLGTIAVVGRPCSAVLMAQLCDLDDRSLARAVDELWRRGILCETGADAYEFSHGKLRDAAYESLSPPTRRALHSDVATLLVGMADCDPQFASNEVAAHFEAANRPHDAIAWLQRAALDAQRVFAYGEALRLLDRALALVPALPADVRHVRELELLSTVPVSLAAVDGFATDRMQETHERAASVAASLGVDLEPSFMRSMVMSALCRDEFAEAAHAARRLLQHADATGDGALRVESLYLLGISAFWAAHLDDARRHFETVLAEFDPSTRRGHIDTYGQDPQVVCQSRLANTLWFLGHADDARAACERALALALEVGHPFSLNTAATFACLLAVDLGDDDRLRDWSRHLNPPDRDSVPFSTNREVVLGLLDVLDGRPRDGTARTAAALASGGGRNYYPGFQASIARVALAAHAAAGDANGGLAICTQALARRSTPLWDAEFRRARAEFLHVAGAKRSANAASRTVHP